MEKISHKGEEWWVCTRLKTDKTFFCKGNIEECYGGEDEPVKETFMVEVVGFPQYGLTELCCEERQDGVRMKGGKMG